MKDNLEQVYDDFLDTVDPDDIKELEDLTDDMGLKESFWDLYQHSKNVLDYFGRSEFTDEMALGIYSLIYHLESIRDDYEERLEKNDELVRKLDNFLCKVPESFWDTVHDETFKPMTFSITPMSREKRRALDLARQVQSNYIQQVKGKPDDKIDLGRCHKDLATLIALNVLFIHDVPDDEFDSDPVISITSPLTDIYKTICNSAKE